MPATHANMCLVPRIGSGIPLVARGREIAGLRAAVERARTGAAGAVLVSGEAGVGKTRLVDELTTLVTDTSTGGAADVVVLTGRCVDAGEAGLPYLPFVEALAPLPNLRRWSALGLLFPDITPAHTEAPPEIGALQLFDAVHGALAEHSAETCVVLVLEDLHWADGSTRALLSFLVSRLRGQRLLVVGTYRSDDLHRRHPLRALIGELVRLPTVERVDLGPFTAEASREFVATLAEGRLTDELIREVADRSEGNAFFAEELLAAHTECGVVIPATLVDVLLTRMERLGEAAQRLVRVASVAGRSVAHARLRAVADLGDTDLEDALREAVQHHILVAAAPDPMRAELYRFRHALLREAVYGDLLPGERVRLHAAYARELAAEADVRGSAAALAFHSLQSHDLPTALAASVRAAAEADRHGAPADALGHYEQALKVWDAVAVHARPAGLDELTLLRRTAAAAGPAGEPERAIAFGRSAVRAADAAGDAVQAARVRKHLAEALYALSGKETEAHEVIESAWSAVADAPPSATKAWVLTGYAGILRGFGRGDEARRRAEQSIEVAREVADGEAAGAEADALITLATLDESQGRVQESQRRLRAAMARATEAGALNVELRARFWLAVNLYEHGAMAEAVRVVDDGVERARATGMTWSPFGLELRVLQVVAKYACGDWDGAEAAAEPPGQRVSNTVSARLTAVGVYVVVGRGRFDEAQRLVEELRGQWHRDLEIALFSGGAATELDCWRGKPDQAARWVRDALAAAERAGGQHQLAGIRLAALGIAANADLAVRATGRRDPQTAEAAVQEGVRLVEHARKTAELGSPRTGALGNEGVAWLARAEAEASRLRGASDPALWRAAVRGFDYGAVYEQAVCRWRLADALLAGDDRADGRDEAERELLDAYRMAERIGARPLSEAARSLARRARLTLGDTPRPPAEPATDVFTPRERSVLELVAHGRTNRQVGDELFISEKTVSVHLSRVMAKLGATRRAEAVAIAYDRGLLEQPS